MFKVTNKCTRTTSSETFWVSGLKVFNAYFDNVFVSWALILLPFCRKILSFWKKIQVFIGNYTILI